MSEMMNTIQDPFYFIVTGIPVFEEAYHIWISIPFCCLYTVSIMGNTAILTVIRTESSLIQPMYLFEDCFAQFLFLHAFSVMESSVLLAMSFDCYVAICCPIHYATILTNSVVGRMGLSILCRSVLAALPSLFLLKHLPFCHSHLLSHSYFNNWYVFAVVLLIIVMDPLLIVLSDTLILKSILGTASWTERLWALSNCLCHILALLVLYVSMVGVSMIHRFAKRASPLVHIIMANIYLLVPPVKNPILYSGVFHLISQRSMHLR
ncbi:hypothetical protein FD754_024047 [Muntiacus muntjak]|uniref:G-protein coupled receptors family 1 profile domain-containing protein n=1 Tax=Muntiacus muntjak TaxID=9888 RepID=A0A5N3UR53_MUNMU|nr:hypothetical protein FD754_024047 [Muntiacus muntjak]